MSSTPIKEEYKVVVMGDSLVAGYGLNLEGSLPYKLQQWLRDNKSNVLIEVAGLSGDTSFGLLNRLPFITKSKPDAAIIVIGGNDLLRGISPDKTKKNINEIVASLKQKGIFIMLVECEAPLSYGPAYQQQIKQIYRDMNGKDVILLPFILRYTLGKPQFMQADGIHPNAEGVNEIIKSIGPLVLKNLPK